MTSYYIDRGGEQVYRPPFSAQGVDFWGFVFEGDKAAMQHALCDKALNAVPGEEGRFEVALPFCILVYNKIHSLVSVDPPYSARGLFPEQESAIWTLIRDNKTEKLFFYHPYIFVDNSYALSMGREIYGFPKALGTMSYVTQGQGGTPHDKKPLVLETQTLVVPSFGPDVWAEEQPLFSVTNKGPGNIGVEVIDSLKALAVSVYDLLAKHSAADNIELAAHELEALLSLDISMIFLKQFRDVGNPALAVGQSIVRLDTRVTQLNGIGLYTDDYDLAFNDYASHPLFKDLGLTQKAQTSIANFWVGFDMWIGPGFQA